MSLSIVLITKNSEKTLPHCLASIQVFSAPILVVDGASTDQTVEIAKSFGALIFTRSLDGFGRQKQFALDLAETDWIFLIDSDEQITPELAAEIKNKLSQKDDIAAYRVARRNYYFGKPLRFGGKYPDYQVRLLSKKNCRFSDDLLHEKVDVKGSIGTLSHPLHHHSYPDIHTWFEKLQFFSNFRAQELLKKNVKPSFAQLFKFCFFRPGTRWIRRFILKGGFLDGLPGFWACLHDALTEIFCYLIFTEEYRRLHGPR